jgi:hypothetical protein
LIDNQHKYTNYNKTEKLTIYKGTKILLEQFKEYKNKYSDNIIIEDIEMDDNQPTTRSFSEGEVMQLLSSLLQQQQQQQQQVTTP